MQISLMRTHYKTRPSAAQGSGPSVNRLLEYGMSFVEICMRYVTATSICRGLKRERGVFPTEHIQQTSQIEGKQDPFARCCDSLAI